MKYKLPEGWKEVKLGDIVDILGDGLHGTPQYDEDGDYYFINGRNLKGEIFIDDKTKRINYDEYIKYKKDLNDRTIFLSINGTIGNIAYYNNEKIMLGKSACYINIKEEISKDYIKYILMDRNFKNYSINYATGTTIKNLGLKQIREFTFNLPPSFEQQAIADTLSSLDDKIEINNKINENLEEQAQAIFKHWFIDFEFPDENGNPYKSSGGKMIESKLDMIPQGWEVKSLDEVADFLNGIAIAKYKPETEEDSLPAVKIRELRQGFTDSSSDKCSTLVDEKYIINDYDMIFAWSGSLLIDIWVGDEAILNQHLFKVTSEKYDQWYYYYWTKHFIDEFIEIAKNKATTMGHINRSHLSDAKVLLPDSLAYEEIGNVLSRLLNLKMKKRKQNQKLSQLRDTLLPKLMSGEIRIPLD